VTVSRSGHLVAFTRLRKRLIRTAGFEPVKVGGTGQSGRLEVGGDLHGLVVGAAKGRALIGGA
jgi:hypothetical protein